jgi:RNA polymerase sigma-70 factor (ECF subfamily)
MIRTPTDARALSAVADSSSKGTANVDVQDSPVTRASLLVRLRDRTDHRAWQEFVDLYGPMIYGFARKRGLQDADSADMMQDVLRSVSNAIERLDYDPNQGRFRGWLFTITRNRINNLHTSRKGKARASGGEDGQEMLAAHPDGRAGLEADWELEYQRRLAAIVLEQLRPEFSEKIWDAFWQTSVNGEAGDEVARRLGMSTGAVYVAKSRVLARVRAEVQRRLELDEVEVKS